MKGSGEVPLEGEECTLYGRRHQLLDLDFTPQKQGAALIPVLSASLKGALFQNCNHRR
jgi:hypothetical protein